MAIPEFTSGQVDIDAVCNALVNHGGCIIRKIASPAEIDQINKEIKPYLDASEPAETFWPKETKRTFGLLDKSRLLTKVMLYNEVYQRTCDRFLTRKHTSWMGNTQQTNVSRPVIGSTTAFAIGPGAAAQALHRDDAVYQNKFAATTPENYTYDREIGIQCFLAGSQTTIKNGATRIIPGSHLMNYGDPPDESKVVCACLDPGDGFIMLPSCYHGGGANQTVDSERILYDFFMIGGLYRQEENQFLAVDPHWAKENLDRQTLGIMGYDSSGTSVGYVNYSNPLDTIMVPKKGLIE